MERLDLKKTLEHLYGPSAREVVEVEAPQMRFLMVDGEGDPNTSEAYREAVEALFALSYALKFAVKKSAGVDYGVMPLEGLWWADDMSRLDPGDKTGWKWTAMIMQPGEYVRQGEGPPFHRGARRRKERQAPRDLPERLQPNSAGEPQSGDPPTLPTTVSSHGHKLPEKPAGDDRRSNEEEAST